MADKNQQKSSEQNLICQKSIVDNSVHPTVQLERSSDFQKFRCKTMTATKQMHQQQHENVSDKLNNVSTSGSNCFVKSYKNDSSVSGGGGALNACGKVFKKILQKNNSNKNNNTKIGLTMSTITMPDTNTTTTSVAIATTLTTTVDSSAITATPSVNVKKMDKTKMGTETGTPGTEICHERDDDSRMKKKRCTDRYDSSESSDSGVATLSCTDSSTASSDASDPGSPYSPGSIGEDTHQSSKTNMPPQIIQAAQLQQQHQTNSVKSQWPWNTSKTVVNNNNNNNNNNVKSNHNNNLTTTINNNTNSSVTTTNNKLKRISSQTTGDIVGTPKKLRTTANNNASEKFTTTASNNNNNNNNITNSKRLKTTSITAPEETQQTKITGYFKSQMKPLNGLKREISNLVARSGIDTQSVNSGLDKFFILAKSKDEKDQNIANGIKKDYELDVRTLTTTTTVSSLKKLERKTTKIAHVVPTTRKNSNAHIKTLSTSNLIESKSPKKHVAIAPRTSDIKKTTTNTNTLRKSLMTSAAKNLQQIENCKNSQPTVLLTAIRIPVSHHQTITNGQTKIAPKPSPASIAAVQQTTNMSATSSQGLTTSPSTKVNSVFQIPVMPNLVQIPNIITANRANLVVNNNGQLARVGNGTQYFLNGTVIKVQQIGSATTATATNGVQNLGHMDNSSTGNILVKQQQQQQQPTIAQTVPFTSTSIGGGTTTAKGTLTSTSSQTAITTATQLQQNGNNQRLQTQPSVFMATSGGLLLNATLPAVISTSKLPGLTQALPALHPIQQTTQNANILPSINTLLQPHHHHHHQHQHQHHSTLAAATNSISSQQFIVSQSSHHQSLVNMSPIATLSPITRSQQNFQLSDVVTSKLSEPPSLRLITNCCTNDSITSTSSLTTTTTTTTSTTFTPTLTSWSKQIAETIQNDSDKTIRRDSFLGGRTSLSIREPTLPPLLPLTLPSISSSSSSTSSTSSSSISTSTSVVSLSNKCEESRLSTDIENVKSPPSEPSEDTSEPSIPSSELSNQSVLSSTDENSTSTIRDEVAKVCLPSAKSFKIEEIQNKTLPDVFIDDDEEESTEKLQIKSSSIQDIVSNGNGYKVSTIVEVDIELVNNHKTTKECAISPILSQPKTIRFPALKSDSNFRFGPKGTKRHDGVCYWDHCNQKYDTCSKLLDHLQTTHVNTQTGPFSCLWSGCKVHSRESCSRRWLERHVLSHGGTKPFKCIVDGCGLRFGSQLALQKHVNGHFNTTESKDNSNKKASDPPVPKQLRKNGKKLRYRRQPFSARLFDFFDSGIMEGLQHRLMVTGSLASGPKGSITFHGRTMARRVTFEGKPEVFVRWNPSDIIADEWIPEKQGALTKMVTIHSMRSQELIALQKYLGIAYNNSDIKKVFKDEETSLAVSLNNSFTRINSRKHSRKPPKQNTQPS